MKERAASLDAHPPGCDAVRRLPKEGAHKRAAPRRATRTPAYLCSSPFLTKPNPSPLPNLFPSLFRFPSRPSSCTLPNALPRRRRRMRRRVSLRARGTRHSPRPTRRWTPASYTASEKHKGCVALVATRGGHADLSKGCLLHYSILLFVIFAYFWGLLPGGAAVAEAAGTSAAGAAAVSSALSS
jgi:hypothetical protein